MKLKTILYLLLFLPGVMLGQGGKTIQVQAPCPTGGGQTIYVDNVLSGGGQTIRSGGRVCNNGLNAYKSQMAFWSGNFDFENNLWLDQSGNGNHASLVETGCVSVINDLTLTLLTARAGATIAKVNESASLTTGVSINGSGHIAIDQSALVVNNSKIWSIELSTGELFVLQTMASPYVFASGNIATISGTENTDWAWSTSNSAYPYHLKNGFSKMPYSFSVNNTCLPYLAIENADRGEWYWEGILLSGTVFFNFYIAEAPNKNYAVRILSNNVEVTTRTTGSSPKWTNPGNIDLSRWVKIKVKYNGSGILTSSNWTIEVNGNSQVATDGTLAFTDRNGLWWAGNSANTSLSGVKNFYVALNGIKNHVIIDGVFQTTTSDTTNRPSKYLYIPAFNNVDAIGQIPTNKSFPTIHNGAETKIIFPVASLISDNDVNHILFTNPSTPNILDIKKFYPEFGKKIHINNGTINQYKDFIITKSQLDLCEYVNGYSPFKPQVSLRTDRHSGNLFGNVLNDNDAYGDTHTTRLIDFSTPSYQAAILNRRMVIGLHDMPPAFWMYKDFKEGQVAYNAATDGERSNYTVIEDQGTITGLATGYTETSLNWIKDIHNLWGVDYPIGLDPDVNVDNGLWWEWVMDAFINRVKSYGATGIDVFTLLGWLPAGINQLHPDVFDLLFSKVYSNNYINRSLVTITDSLSENVSIFSGSLNASIVDDLGVNVQKLSGFGTSAYGIFKLGSYENYGIAPYQRLKFDFYVDQGVVPFSALHFFDYSTAKMVGSIAGLSTDTWYTLIIQWSGTYYDIRIYNPSSECVYLKRSTLQNINTKYGRFKITANGSDILIKNMTITLSYDRYLTIYPYSNVKWDDGATYTNQTASEWLEIKKTQTTSDVIKGNIPYLFGHYVQNTPELHLDGTYDGVIVDRSWWGFDSWVKWCKAQGYQFVNTETINPTSIYRRNLLYFPYLNNMVADESQISNSIDGSNVYKLSASVESTLNINFRSAGLKLLKFWSKGDFYIRVESNMYRGNPNSPHHRIKDALYTYHEIPIYIDPDSGINLCVLTITSITDSWFHKIAIDDL